MKQLLILPLILLGFSLFGQDQRDAADFISEGKVKMTHINRKPNKKPQYMPVKKISKITEVKRKNGKVVAFSIYTEQKLSRSGGHEFVARGNENPDGSLDNVFGFYSKTADKWAVAHKGSIYVLNCPLRESTYEFDLRVVLALGDNTHPRKEILESIKPIRTRFKERKEQDSNASAVASAKAKIEREAPWRIKGKDLDKIEVVYYIKKDNNHPAGHIGYFSRIAVGVKIHKKDGTSYLTNNFLDGKGFLDDFEIEVDGAYYDTQSAQSELGFYAYGVSPQDHKDDQVTIRVKSKYHDLSDEVVLDLDYSQPLHIYYEGKIPFAADAGDGRNIEVNVSATKHSRTGERLIRYDIHEQDGDRLNSIKLEPEVLLFVHNRGGKANAGYQDGQDGSFSVNVNGQIDDYNLKNDSRGKRSTSNTGAAKGFTIVNNSGTAIHLIDEGGNGEGTLNNGSSAQFDCDETIYQAHKNGSGTWNVKGRLIASGKSSCGQTISFK